MAKEEEPGAGTQGPRWQGQRVQTQAPSSGVGSEQSLGPHLDLGRGRNNQWAAPVPREQPIGGRGRVLRGGREWAFGPVAGSPALAGGFAMTALSPGEAAKAGR